MLDDYYDDPFQNFQSYVSPDESGAGTPQKKNPFDEGLQYYQSQRDPISANTFWKEDDPNYQTYKNLVSQAPASEGILRNYLSSMPTHEQYEPSTGRKIAGFLLGTLSGANNPALAAVNAKKFIDDPYNDALQDWKNQGSNVDLQAKLSDAARNRQIKSLSDEAKNRMMAERYADLAGGRQGRQATANAKGYVGADQGQQRLEQGQQRNDLAESNANWLHAFRQQQQDFTELLRNAQLGLQGDKFDHSVNNPNSKPTSPSTELRNENAQGQLENIEARKATANDMKSNPAFKDVAQLFKQYEITNPGKDPFENVDEIIKPMDPERARLFKVWLGNTLYNHQQMRVQ